MPLTKQHTARYPRTWVFDNLHYEGFSSVNVAISNVNTAVLAVMPLATGVKIAKVAVAWTAMTDATPSFNIVYNTAQALGSARSYTQGNVVPPDNSYTAGITASTVGATVNTVGFPNPALTTAYPNFQQIGGLGIPTNVAVDGQPVFAADVVFNTTNFPGAGTTTGGQGILIPTNYDAVYPAGVYPYGVAQGLPNAADLPASFTLRATTGGTETITNLTVSLLLVPILLTEALAPTAVVAIPGTSPF